MGLILINYTSYFSGITSVVPFFNYSHFSKTEIEFICSFTIKK